MKNPIKALVKTAVGIINEQTLTGRLPSVGSPNYFLINGQFVGSADNMETFVRKGFLGNSTVYSIVTAQARKFGSIPVLVYRKTKDRDSFKAYKYYSDKGQWRKAFRYRKKALEPAGDTELAKLLERPNPMQGQSAFFENLLGFKLLTGAGTAWANRPLPDRPPLELWCLPTQDIVIIVQDRDYLIPAGYQLQVNYIANLRKADVLYWKYFNPQWSTNGSHLYGLPPLRSGMLDVDIDNLAKTAQGTLLDNQGAKGVLFRKGVEMISPEERDAIKFKINENINGRKNLGRIEVANTELGYLNLGMNSTDMGIVDVRNMTKEDICNVFHHPKDLLAGSDATYQNYETAERVLAKIICGEWCGLRDELNPWLTPMYPGENLWIEPDFTLMPELQRDVNITSQVVQRLWQLTPNQALEYMGLTDYTDEDDPAMNQRYIPTSYQLLSDVAIPAEDIDMQGIEDYNDPANEPEADEPE